MRLLPLTDSLPEFEISFARYLVDFELHGSKQIGRVKKFFAEISKLGTIKKLKHGFISSALRHFLSSTKLASLPQSTNYLSATNNTFFYLSFLLEGIFIYDSEESGLMT